ncbi:hypothetical protein EUX98_g7863 [Antrodiella citrinella]|uniref:Uncharacterized protein n=1 Tax=Antrodiella citrinella TaxID=2447956 RepID=A0A4S4MM60_9APHY|nr:hypothetical protein EUX98_g7863 [Antrodiella citrinella]
MAMAESTTSTTMPCRVTDLGEDAAVDPLAHLPQPSGETILWSVEEAQASVMVPLPLKRPNNAVNITEGQTEKEKNDIIGGEKGPPRRTARDKGKGVDRPTNTPRRSVRNSSHSRLPGLSNLLPNTPVRPVWPTFHDSTRHSNLFQDLVLVEISGRPTYLPPMYRYIGGARGDVHPLQRDKPVEGSTYVYVLDTSRLGLQNALDCSLIADIPKGDVNAIASMGLMELTHGDWVMCRKFGEGELGEVHDATKDVLQMFVPQRKLLKAVAEGTRCYPLGLTYEKPTTICAPNANSKVVGGASDARTDMRADFMKAAVRCATNGFKEVPLYVEEMLTKRAEAVNMARIGDHANLFWPAVQVNIATAVLNTSDQSLEGEMGVFGGSHTDGYDLAGGYSCMVTCCDVPDEYEAGRFHLLGLGVYIRLDVIDQVYFTGRLRHGGTPPLAPPGELTVDASAYRCVVICYPSAPIVTGVVRTPMATSNVKGETVSVPSDFYYGRPPVPQSTHATMFADGSSIMEERDHFNHCVRSLLLHNLNLLLQLPTKNIQLDVDKFMTCITATIDNQDNVCADKWTYAPQTLPLGEATTVNMTVPSSDRPAIYREANLFPMRAESFREFIKRLHEPHAGAIPEIALKGINEDSSFRISDSEFGEETVHNIQKSRPGQRTSGSRKKDGLQNKPRGKDTRGLQFAFTSHYLENATQGSADTAPALHRATHDYSDDNYDDETSSRWSQNEPAGALRPSSPSLTDKNEMIRQPVTRQGLSNQPEGEDNESDGSGYNDQDLIV